MVSDVSAGRVAADKNPAKISDVGEPGVGVIRQSLGLEPAEGGEAVVDGGGKAILGSETVVGGDDESGEVEGKAKAVVLAVGPGAGADAEAAAVNVEEDREEGSGGGTISGLIQTQVKPVNGIKEEVLP